MSAKVYDFFKFQDYYTLKVKFIVKIHVLQSSKRTLFIKTHKG